MATSWNDEWFRDATKEEVQQIYGDKGYLLKEALEHWRKMNPVQKRKTEKPDEKEQA